MVVTTYDFEVNSIQSHQPGFSKPSPSKLHVWPKAVPQLIKSFELEGDGSPGSVAKINFADGNLAYSYSVVEGGFLGGKLEKISYENKFVAGANGGTIVKSLMKYHTTRDSVYTEDEIKALIEKTEGLYKLSSRSLPHGQP